MSFRLHLPKKFSSSDKVSLELFRGLLPPHFREFGEPVGFFLEMIAAERPEKTVPGSDLEKILLENWVLKIVEHQHETFEDLFSALSASLRPLFTFLLDLTGRPPSDITFFSPFSVFFGGVHLWSKISLDIKNDRCTLPLELFEKFNISPSSFLSRNEDEKFPELILDSLKQLLPGNSNSRMATWLFKGRTSAALNWLLWISHYKRKGMMKEPLLLLEKRQELPWGSLLSMVGNIFRSL